MCSFFPCSYRDEGRWKLLPFLLNNRLLLWSYQPRRLWSYKLDSINKRPRTTSENYQDWDLSERLFGDVCTAQAHYYVWLRSILFSTMKTDLAYDILSILNKARLMLWGVTLDLPLYQVFPRSGEARNCFFMHRECKVGSPLLLPSNITRNE